VIQESEPKALFALLPVLLVSANTKDEEKKVRKELYGMPLSFSLFLL
jgi:hypothetical protein